MTVTDPRLSSINWGLRDSDIAKAYSMSREWVRQLRLKAKATPSKFHRLSKEGVRLAQWVINFRSYLSGKVTQEEFLAVSDTSLTIDGAVRIAIEYDFEFLPTPLWFERLNVNTDLPNVDIERIWQLSYNRMGSTRSEYDLGRPRWDVRGGRRPTDPAYARALLAEIIKARALRPEE